MKQTSKVAGFRAGRHLVGLVGFAVASLLALWVGAVQAYSPPPIDGGMLRAMEPALGINADFGRWTGTVQLVYDPDNVPAMFSSSTKMVALLQQAAAKWEKVCGIRFEVVKVDSAAPDDSTLSVSQRDGLVRVSWVTSTGFAGQAGPQFGNYNQNLGYFPYYDGSVQLDKNPDTWDSDEELVSTLVHEFGHLLGLGHSENPLSVMYANPYNFLLNPREDDIRAVQVLYGVGTGGVDPPAGVSEWKYSIPPTAAQSVTQNLFKPNEITSNAAFLALSNSSSTKITTVSDATADGQFLRFYTGGLGSFANTKAISFKTVLVVVDPDGYQWDKFDLPLDCPAGNACGSTYIGFIQTQVLKTYPGLWKFLLVDESANSVLLTQTLTVSTTPIVNAAPVAKVSYAAGSSNSKVVFTLNATDKENQKISVVWHAPGGFPVDQNVASDGTAVQTIDFSVPGTYTMYVELNDNGAFYSDAGDGFSNLLRLTVNLPLSGIAGGVTVQAQHLDAQSILKSVAAAHAFGGVSTGGATTAGFTMGASKDSGATTATTFKAGDNIQISGAVQPQTADLNKAADIFVVIRSVIAGKESWAWRDSNGLFHPWTYPIIPDLNPALSTTSLQSGAVVEAYKGVVAAGSYGVFIGYRLTGSTVLHYTNVPLQLTVSN